MTSGGRMVSLEQARAQYVLAMLPAADAHPQQLAARLPAALRAQAPRLIAARRLWPRLSALLAVPRPDMRAVPDAAEAPALLGHEALARAAVLAGVGWHAQALARLIEAEARHRLVDAVGEQAYRFALRHRDLAPAGLPQVEPDALPGRARAAGAALLQVWLDSLRPSLRARVALKLAPTEAHSDPVAPGEQGRALALFRAAAQEAIDDGRDAAA